MKMNKVQFMDSLRHKLDDLPTSERDRILFAYSDYLAQQTASGISEAEAVRQLGPPDASGRRRPMPVEGSEFIIECDQVIVAIGQYQDNEFFPDGFTGVSYTESQVLFTSGQAAMFPGGSITGAPKRRASLTVS